MIINYGMNEKVGNISFYTMLNESYTRPFSEQTAYLIDQEVKIMIDQQYDRAKNLLRENAANWMRSPKRCSKKKCCTAPIWKTSSANAPSRSHPGESATGGRGGADPAETMTSEVNHDRLSRF
jgi:hypothetical protein